MSHHSWCIGDSSSFQEQRQVPHRETLRICLATFNFPNYFALPLFCSSIYLALSSFPESGGRVSTTWLYSNNCGVLMQRMPVMCTLLELQGVQCVFFFFFFVRVHVIIVHPFIDALFVRVSVGRIFKGRGNTQKDWCVKLLFTTGRESREIDR